MKNTRNRVRLTESQLHNVIKESVKRVLKEELYHPNTFMNWTSTIYQIGNSLKRCNDTNLSNIGHLLSKCAGMLDNYGEEKYGSCFSDMVDSQFKNEREPEEKPWEFADEEY